ncbi:MAG: UPF0182 family protein, partial [Corynebacterium casei]
KQAQDAMMSSDQVARDMTLWRGSNDLHNGNLLALPVGGGEILYMEPIYSQRKDQASAFPKLLRVLVSYKGRVGYAPTVDAALEQVGIDSAAAQDIEVVDDGGDGGDTGAEEQPADDAPAEDEDTPAAPLPENADDAMNAISDALTGLEDAREGSHEEYGRALDELDNAVQQFQELQNSAE